jgi:hypothetical protein
MLAMNSGFFLQAPTEDNTRVLCPATVTGVQDGLFVASLESTEHAFEPDQEVLIFFEHRREFVQQPARITTLAPTTSGLAVSFETTGQAISAESRQCYRVSTTLADLKATLADERSCDVRDVSITGFSAVGASEFRVGVTLPVKLHFENETFKGQAVVQSTRDLGDGRFRYGLYCAEKAGGGELSRGLQQISMAVQRAQLRRQQRAA